MQSCIHPSMADHCSLDGNHRTPTSSCGGTSSKPQHLAFWQTKWGRWPGGFGVCLWVCLRVRLLTGVPGFSSSFPFTIFLKYLFGVKRHPLSSIRQILPSQKTRMSFYMNPGVLQSGSLSTAHVSHESIKIGEFSGSSNPRHLFHTPPAERIEIKCSLFSHGYF